MNKNEYKIGERAIYDARELGTAKMIVLGLQHMFAMFGATVVVPLITGLDVSTTLLFAGLGTLLFHLISKRKIPAFLGSSFAFLGGYAAIAPLNADGSPSELLPYACFGVACAGLLYLVLAALFRAYGANKVMKYFPPVVTGPIIISIGLNLAPSAINNVESCWWVALIAIIIVVICNIWGKGMIKIIPILLGVVGSYLCAAVAGKIDFSQIATARQCRTYALQYRDDRSDRAGDHDGAHRRYLRYQLYLRDQLHQGSRTSPHTYRRRTCYSDRLPVRCTC